MLLLIIIEIVVLVELLLLTVKVLECRLKPSLLQWTVLFGYFLSFALLLLGEYDCLKSFSLEEAISLQTVVDQCSMESWCLFSIAITLSVVGGIAIGHNELTRITKLRGYTAPTSLTKTPNGWELCHANKSYDSLLLGRIFPATPVKVMQVHYLTMSAEQTPLLRQIQPSYQGSSQIRVQQRQAVTSSMPPPVI